MSSLLRLAQRTRESSSQHALLPTELDSSSGWSNAESQTPSPATIVANGDAAHRLLLDVVDNTKISSPEVAENVASAIHKWPRRWRIYVFFIEFVVGLAAMCRLFGDARSVIKRFPFHPHSLHGVSITDANDGYRPRDWLIPMSGPEDRLLIHTWHSGFLFAGFEILIGSALLTQHLEKSKLIVWMDEPWLTSKDTLKRSAVKRFRYTPSRFVEFRLLNVTDLALQSDSCWKNRPEFMLKYPMISIHGISVYSDIVRILLLHVYGGVWVDSDTTFLVDMQVLHRRAFCNVASGRAVTDYMNLGNNNLLYVTDPLQRQVIADISCEFRERPQKICCLNYTESQMRHLDWKTAWDTVTDVPMTSLGHPLSVLNNWWWNEGIFHVCNALKGLCNHLPLSLNTTDSLWFGAGGLDDFCEVPLPRYGFLTADFEPAESRLPFGVLQQLIRSTRADARNASAYWESQPLENLVWVTHDRKAHCRTLEEGVAGTVKIFRRLIEARMGVDARMVPVEPLDFLAADPLMLPPPSLSDSIFQFLTIFIKSRPENVRMRNIHRTVVSGSKAWLPHDKDPWERQFFNPRLRFVVELTENRGNEEQKKVQGMLWTEMVEFGDIIIVPPATQYETPASRRRLLRNERGKTRTSTPATSSEKAIYQETRRLNPQGDLPFPNLALLEKYGDVALVDPVPLSALPVPPSLRYVAPTLDNNGLDASTWGERPMRGDGFLTPDMELAIMKWSLQEESLFLMVLNSDAIYLNMRQLCALMDKINDGNIFRKTARLSSTLIALPIDDLTAEAIGRHYVSDTVKNGFRPPSPFTLEERVKDFDVAIHRTQLRDSNIFRGLIFTRDIVPYLFSTDNPVRLGFQDFFNCTAAPERRSFYENDADRSGQPLSYSITKHLSDCRDGANHPLNRRLNHRRLIGREPIFSEQAVTISKEFPDYVRILVPRSYGVSTLRFSSEHARELYASGICGLASSCPKEWLELQAVEFNTMEHFPFAHNKLPKEAAAALVVFDTPPLCPEIVKCLEMVSSKTADLM